MSEINYDDTRIEGVIRAFDGLVCPDQTTSEVGNSPVPTPEQALAYAKFIELIMDAQQPPTQDEDLLSAA